MLKPTKRISENIGILVKICQNEISKYSQLAFSTLAFHIFSSSHQGERSPFLCAKMPAPHTVQAIHQDQIHQIPRCKLDIRQPKQHRKQSLAPPSPKFSGGDLNSSNCPTEQCTEDAAAPRPAKDLFQAPPVLPFPTSKGSEAAVAHLTQCIQQMVPFSSWFIRGKFVTPKSYKRRIR